MYCCICQTSMRGSFVMTHCKHSYHLQCLRKIQYPSCPLCKKSIKTLLIRIGVSEREQQKRIREIENSIIEDAI